MVSLTSTKAGLKNGKKIPIYGKFYSISFVRFQTLRSPFGSERRWGMAFTMAQVCSQVKAAIKPVTEPIVSPIKKLSFFSHSSLFVF